MQGCDTLLIAGSTMPWLHYYPKPGQARIVQIDRDPTRLGLRVAIDVAIDRSCLCLLNGNQLSQQRFVPEDLSLGCQQQACKNLL
jgi:thiamine pyrophosphate-dependent acetolactate synthase large subunit-like protein